MIRMSTLGFLLLILATNVGPAVAQDPVGAPVDAGRQALRDAAHFPWYDAETDSLRRIELAGDDSDDAANRASKWESRPVNRSWNWGGFSLDWLWTLLKVASYIFLLALVGGLIWLLIWAFLKGEAQLALSRGVASEEDEDLETEADRIERLPFQVDRPKSDLLGEARRHYEAGNYAEAVIYFFSFQLVQLDKYHWIRLAKGKTNRQYLRELRQQAALREMLEGTMVAFEDVFFGHHPLSRDRFEHVWQQLDEFQSQVQQSGV